jgi:hypothetical protein
MVDERESIKYVEDSRSFSQAESAIMKYQRYQSRLLNVKCKMQNVKCKVQSAQHSQQLWDTIEWIYRHV